MYFGIVRAGQMGLEVQLPQPLPHPVWRRYFLC